METEVPFGSSRSLIRGLMGDMEEKTAPGTSSGGSEEEDMARELDVNDMIGMLLEIIDSVGSFGDFRRTQRKESSNLVWRMKMMAPLLEEIRECEDPIPSTACDRICALLKAFLSAKKLLRFCHDGSKIYLALEREAVTSRFQMVVQRLIHALDGMPFDKLGISEEVKEQVQLTNAQLRRAKKRTDTQDMELAMDLMVVLSKRDDRNADGAIFERLANKLELQTFPDLRTETMAVKKLLKERCGQISAETSQQIVDLLNKFKQIAGVEDCDGLSDVTLPKYLEKCPSLMIPNDFLCPISLEIMADPVVVATGQAYERRSIQKWLDAGHQTCPKTRETLAHLSLASNLALRNLILQWCEKHKVELLRKDADHDSDHPDQKDEISDLVENLSSVHLNAHRAAVEKIRMLSKENPDDRVSIAKHGGIPALVNLLSYPDSKIQEHAVTALLNLSIDEGNKRLIAKEGAIPAIIDILRKGNMEAKENSATALFSLSMLEENKIMIGNMNGIPPLVDLLQNGTIRGKKDAVTALFNLVLYNGNKARAVEAGLVPALLQVLGDKNLGMVDEVLSIFLLLASHPDGCAAVGQRPYILTLVQLIKEGTPKNKECALSVLLELGSRNPCLVAEAVRLGVCGDIREIERSGTNRAQRKAKSLLQLISKYNIVKLSKPRHSSCKAAK